MKRVNQYKHLILAAPFVLVMLLQFNNCSKYQPPDMSQASSSSSSNNSSSSASGLTKTGDLCEDTIRELFADGYYQFVRQNCTQCHATDSSRPQFASPDVNWAYQVFQARGYQKVSSNAISPSHQPPSTGTQHTQTINELKLKWQQGVGEYNECKGLPTETVSVDPKDILTVQTSDKKIPKLAVDAEAILTWDLTKDLSMLKPNMTLPNMGRTSSLQIKVTRRKTAGGQDYYAFHDPIIFNNATDVKVKTIYVKLNTRLVMYPSTFKFTNKDIYANSTNAGENIGLLSTGGMVAMGVISDLDFVNVAFETLEPQVLGPRPAPVTIGFTSIMGGKITSSIPANRDVAFEVSSNLPPDSPVVVSVEPVNDAVCNASGDNAFTVSDTCMKPVYDYMKSQGLTDAANLQFKKARNVSDGGDFNRFDWDYKVITNSFNLYLADQRKNAVIRFSTDIRRETNRVLRLRVNVMSNNGKISTTNSDMYVVILKANNPALANGEVAFSSLMRAGTGTLVLNCVKCHNSRDLNGGYDMTNFDLMVTKRVIIQDANNPDYAADNSKMFNRMNPDYPGNSSLSPMPLDGFLTQDALIDQVRQWIRSGAKNN